MRFSIYIAFLCFISSVAIAQLPSPAADKDAIDLSGRMDTLDREILTPHIDVGTMLNVGDRNSDGFEDVIFGYGNHFGDFYKLRFGGLPSLLDSSNNLDFYVNLNNLKWWNPTQMGDFNGDGINDLICEDALFVKGKKEAPYFDTTGTTFYFEDGYNYGPINTNDYDGDGIDDVLMMITQSQLPLFGFRLYPGDKNFDSPPRILNSDSLYLHQCPTFVKGTAVAKFRPSKPEMVVFAWYTNNDSIKNRYNIGMLRHDVPLGKDSIIWISNSDSGGIAAEGLYSMDITGDGIPDLLVSDAFNVYIFKGGDDFGTYQLTPGTAFYRIKSPRLLDFGQYGFVNKFGTVLGMRDCGNLSGSGIPYIAIEGLIEEAGTSRGYTFFYAGGKALDSLFDGMISAWSWGIFPIDTLHSVDGSGRTALLVSDGEDRDAGNRSFDMLLHRDSEKLPHKLNPQMGAVRTIPPNEFTAMPSPMVANQSTKLYIESQSMTEASIYIYNLLGQVIETRHRLLESGENTELFSTSEWTSGTYIVKVETPGHATQTKFLISH